MSNPFAALMPFLQASGLVGLPPEAVGDDINVLRRQDAVPQTQSPLLGGTDIDPEASPLSLDNRRFIEQRDETMKKREEFAPRKGMFGIKGTLRDVLGALGDNYLIQNGQKPRYQAMREQERLQDAMAGFTQMDPRAVAENLTGVDPGAGMDFYKNAVGQQQAAQRLAQQGQAIEATAGKNSQDAFKEGSRLFGQYAGAIARNPQLAGRLMPVLNKIREQYGLDTESFPIPGEEDVGLAEGFQYGGTPTQAQIADTRKIEQAAAKESQFTRAEAGRMARDNPPAARQPTRQEQAEGLYRRAIGGDKEAQALFDRLYPAPKKTRTRTPSSAGAPAVGTKKGGYTFKGGNPADPKNWKKD